MPPQHPSVTDEHEEEDRITPLGTRPTTIPNKKLPYHRSFSEQIPYPEKKDTFGIRNLSSDYVSIQALKGFDRDGMITIVVVPSLDLDRAELLRMTRSIENYEERQLYNLLMLDNPGVQVVFISSQAVSERVVGYYLSLQRTCGEKPDMFHRLSRLYMFSPNDPEFLPLSDKLLSRPCLVHLIRQIANGRIAASSRCYIQRAAGLSVFTPSPNSDQLAKQLGIKLLEAGNDDLYWGTKQGSREVFQACGIPFPSGTPIMGQDDDLLSDMDGIYGEEGKKCIRSSRALAVGLARQILLHGVHPRKWVIKLNQGFSGKGNAILDLRPLCDLHPHLSLSSRIQTLATDIESLFPLMHFSDSSQTWSGPTGYSHQIHKLGVIAESFIEGEVPSSPSVQIVIDSDSRTFHLLSTHEQLLDGQIYYGCRNPASGCYRGYLVEYGERVGRDLAGRGISGHFSVDFLALRDEEGWSVNAIEINLRQGGTTHPFSVMALLCGGNTDNKGIFRMNDGRSRCYIATDIYQNEDLVGMSGEELIDALESASAKRIHWDNTEKRGSVFHLFRFLQSTGRIGFTSIAETEEEASLLYADTEAFLSGLGKKRAQMLKN